MGFNSNGAVYHTLKQPGKPSDDYNYPGNTNIANQPSSEMEYTYARDTDIPRVTTDKKAGPKKPASDAVYPPDLYKCPGTNIPAELEYIYAKDADIPRTHGDPSPPPNCALYHTLEEKNPHRISRQPKVGYRKFLGNKLSFCFHWD